MRQLNLLFALLGLAVLGSCQKPLTPHEPYLQEAFAAVKKYSIRADSFDIDSLERAYLAQLHDSLTPPQIHDLLRTALQTIDPHSNLYDSATVQSMKSGTSDWVADPHPYRGKLLGDRFAYVDMMGFRGMDSVTCNLYVDSLHLLLRKLKNQHPEGWIIDLRQNNGGNMWAMLAGMGPLLGEGILGYSVDNQGQRNPWYYMLYNDSTETYDHLTLADSAYHFHNQLPIAVIVGENTGSAGESVALAFRGNPHARLFGTPTYGFTTGNRGYYMPDSAWLSITHSVDADRSGRTYGGPIQPDEEISDGLQLFERVYQWIDKRGNEQ